MNTKDYLIAGKVGIALIKRLLIKESHLRSFPLTDDIIMLRILHERPDRDELNFGVLIQIRERISNQILEWTFEGDYNKLSEYSKVVKTLRQSPKPLTELQTQTITAISLVLEGKEQWPETQEELRQRVDSKMKEYADTGAFSKLLDQLGIKPFLKDRSVDNILRHLSK